MNKVIYVIILMLAVSNEIFGQIPSWNVDPTDFENSMTVTAVLSIENSISTDPNDIVAAFVNGQIRGVAQPTIDVPSTGQKVVFLQIYSNQSGGENISFKIYKAYDNEVIDAVNQIAFSSNASLGSNSNPYVISDNQAPTDLLISNTVIAESTTLNSQVALFFAQDNDIGETFTYQLAMGNGDDDNDSFSITGNGLILQSDLDYELDSTLSIRVKATDSKNGVIVQVFELSVSDAADGPINLLLSSIDIDENNQVGDVIGMLSTVDQDENDEFSYTLLDDADGGFTIQDNQLLSAESFNFERQRQYLIEIETMDGSGLTFKKTFNIKINDVNDDPTALMLDNLNIEENIPINSLVGLIFTEDEDTSEVTSYSFINGNNNNDSFFLAGDSLKTFEVFNYELTPSLLVEIRAEDSGGSTIDQVFVINVLDDNDPSVSIQLDRNTINENKPIGTEIGTFTTADEDVDDTLVYSLVSGIGDEGNPAFRIENNVLLSDSTFDYEKQRLFNIRVSVLDQSGAGPEQVFGVLIENENDPPNDILLSNLIISENNEIDAVIGTLNTQDQDAGDSFIYNFASGNGEKDNNSFVIIDKQVLAKESFDFEDQNLYSIRLKTTDILGANFEKVFEIQVEDVNEPPALVLEQEFTVYEDEAPNFNVGQVLVEDQDDENFNFSILEDQVPFTIDSITGDIFISDIGLDFEKQDFYELPILVEDPGGLSDVQSISILVLDVIEAELPVNNFISDNGDGKNDVFFIQNVNLYSEYVLSIFNSSGVLVYRTGNYSNNWSGKALNGKPLPEGVYYYVFANPEAQEFKGGISLVR